MNTFLTIMSFAVVASAAPQFGYSYQQGKPAFRPSPQASNSGSYSFQQSPPLAPFNVQSHQQQQNVGSQFNSQAAHTQYPTPIQVAQYPAPVQQQNIYSGPGAVIQNTQSNYQPQHQQKVIVSKDIFIHAAPEEFEEINNEQSIEPTPIRKNYRIVFVKAPSHNIRLNLASYKRAQASNEEKTVIYVLSKKPDLATIQNQLAEVQTEQKAQKPEVYFIKYKTQEEANRAQEEIQAQYDSLGGSTSISNEGIAPITSVIGGGRVNVGSIGSSFNGGSVSSVGPSFTGGNVGPVDNSLSAGNVGSVGTSFNGGNIGSGGASFTGDSFGTSVNSGNSGFFNSGSNIQSYQSSQASSNSDNLPSPRYLPSKHK